MAKLGVFSGFIDLDRRKTQLNPPLLNAGHSRSSGSNWSGRSSRSNWSGKSSRSRRGRVPVRAVWRDGVHRNHLHLDPAGDGHSKRLFHIRACQVTSHRRTYGKLWLKEAHHVVECPGSQGPQERWAGVSRGDLVSCCRKRQPRRDMFVVSVPGKGGLLGGGMVGRREATGGEGCESSHFITIISVQKFNHTRHRSAPPESRTSTVSGGSSTWTQ